MQTNKCILPFIALLLLIAACKKEAKQPDLGYNYFPTTIGSWVIYDVDSIVHNDFTGTIDTFQYQVKELLESDFSDNEGRISQRIERSIRQSDTSQFVIKDVWFQTRTVARAEKIEENFRIIKLVFPPKEGETWDGNALNSLQEEEFEIKARHVPETINDIAVDSVVKVLQVDQQNIIEKKYATEWYASNIGLVYKEIINLDLQNNSGLEYKMQISSFGSN